MIDMLIQVFVFTLVRDETQEVVSDSVVKISLSLILT